MKIDLKKGVLEGVPFLASAHCDARSEHLPLDMIVVHGISLPPGEFGAGVIEPFFCGKLEPKGHPYLESIADLKVSAHLLIDRLGQVTQFVPFHQRAWHAGVSQFKDRTGCNDYSIGIELEGTDEQPYEKIQYQQLANVIKLLRNAYPGIIPEHIVGHSDIAPGRKTDPGPFFDWDYLSTLLTE